MFKKKIVNKCLAFGLSFSIVFGGMSAVTAGAEETETVMGLEIAQSEEDAEDECPNGQQEEVYEYGELLEISEKSAEAEGIALTRKEQKAAEKAEKKAAKEQEKEDKKNQKEQEKEDKKDQKEQEKEEKEQQKEERKLAKRLEKEVHNKTSVENSVMDYDETWSVISVGSVENGICVTGADVPVNDPVRVAILDSGVDYTSDIDVYLRKNFIPGQDEISVIYEDISGHGTSVAGIIAAKGIRRGDSDCGGSGQQRRSRVSGGLRRSNRSRRGGRGGQPRGGKRDWR